MLWQNLKRNVHKQMLENPDELKQNCKEEWAKMSPQ